MHITQHVIKRFQERITFETTEVVRSFIEMDIRDSQHLYKVNNIEKRMKDGIIYVLDWERQSIPTVVTLYLLNEQ
jgi:hypothetical protein